MPANQHQHPQLVFHDRTPARPPGYSAVYSGETMGVVELEGASLYCDSKGPKVLPANGADIGNTALYAAFVALERGEDVRMNHSSRDGSKVIVVPGGQPTRDELRAIPPELRRDITDRLRAVRGMGRLSRRQKLVIGARAQAIADQCLLDNTYSEVA